MINRKNVFRIILIILIASTVAFIFYQSILPPQKSGEVSDKVGDTIGEVIPPETTIGGFIQKNVRKLAHFVEFFILGIFTSVYVVCFLPKFKYALHTLPMAFIIAAIDETIQIFSGRGPAVLDVWLDFSGFFTSSLILYLLSTLVIFLAHKRRRRISESEA